MGWDHKRVLASRSKAWCKSGRSVEEVVEAGKAQTSLIHVRTLDTRDSRHALKLSSFSSRAMQRGAIELRVD
eukprot:47737-Eustigmatos_ZCMA.PRE.1